jgi:hypothetical protein
MNRTALNIGLFVVVAALGATVYFTKDERKAESPPLTALHGEDITRIVLEHPQGAPITLQRKGDEWMLETPVQVRADRFEVATLLNIAAQHAYRKLKLDEINLAELKLAPPQFTLSFNTQKLSFGDVEPLEYRRYVQVGDEVALTDDPSATAVDADYSDLIAKELLPLNPGIRSIEVPGLRIVRDAEDRNWEAKPASALATAETAAQLVEAWRGARAMWNAPMPADGGKGEPITLTLDDQVIRLVLVARDPQLLIDRPDLKIRYTLSKADGDALLQLVATPAPQVAGGS